MGHLALHIQSVDEILLKLQNVANKLHTFNPGMRVFVARRIPTKDEVLQDHCLDAVNYRLDTLESVYIVDMSTTFNKARDLWDSIRRGHVNDLQYSYRFMDNIHQNNQGSEKMAGASLETMLDAGVLATGGLPPPSNTFDTTTFPQPTSSTSV
jgi:hypothetical protein